MAEGPSRTTGKPIVPEEFLAPADHLRAIGVIALAFTALERELEDLFGTYATLPLEARSRLFAKLSKELRVEVLQNCIDASEHPEDLKEAVRYFLRGFHTCFENRNIVMHAESFALFEDGTLVLAKATRSIPTQKVPLVASVAALRATGEAILSFVSYGHALNFYLSWNYGPLSEMRRGSGIADTLPSRPDLPSLLMSKDRPPRT